MGIVPFRPRLPLFDDGPGLGPVLAEQIGGLILELVKFYLESRKSGAESAAYDPASDPAIFAWYRSESQGWPRSGLAMVESAITGRRVRPTDRPRKLSELELCKLIAETAPEQIQGPLEAIIDRWGKLTVWED